MLLLKTKINKNKGFTLIEVLISLLVISLTIGAFLDTTTNFIYRYNFLKGKFLSQHVAWNYTIEQYYTGELTEGEEFVKTMFMDFKVEREVLTTQLPMINQLIIKATDPSGVSSTLSFYSIKI